MTCEQFDDVIAEVAAGVLTGSDRAAALAHVTSCATCARRVAELAGSADAVLLTAPDAEPPVGFESRIVDAIASRRQPRRSHRFALVAAALIVVVAGFAAIAVRTSHQPSGAVRTAAMKAEDGRNVGYAYATTGEPDRVLVQLHGLRGEDDSYRVVVTLRSGRETAIGTIALHGGAGVADLVSSEPARSIARVKVVGAGREYECQGRFTTA